MGISDIQKQSDKEWSPNSEANVVMRTASFGRMPFQLDACIRWKDYEVSGEDKKAEMKQGLGDDMVVPLGLIAATRLQMKEDGKYSKACDMVGGLF
jgi:hypothetical protein